MGLLRRTVALSPAGQPYGGDFDAWARREVMAQADRIRDTWLAAPTFTSDPAVQAMTASEAEAVVGGIAKMLLSAQGQQRTAAVAARLGPNPSVRRSQRAYAELLDNLAAELASNLAAALAELHGQR